MLPKTRNTHGYLAAVLALSLWLNPAVRAADLGPDAVGVRAAYSITSIDTGYKQFQAFADWNLPWGCTWDEGWYYSTFVDMELGALNGWNTTAFVGTLGPALRIGNKKFPVFVEGGCNPTMLSRHQFGPNDYGCNFQFTTYGGVGVTLGERWELGFRFQHMSNAHVAEPNPGLNMLGLGLRCNF